TPLRKESCLWNRLRRHPDFTQELPRKLLRHQDAAIAEFCSLGCWGGPMPLDQRSVLGETPGTHWLSALYRGAGRGRRVVPRTEVPLTGPLSCQRSASTTRRIRSGRRRSSTPPTSAALTSSSRTWPRPPGRTRSARSRATVGSSRAAPPRDLSARR